jgi:hypothetical protein
MKVGGFAWFDDAIFSGPVSFAAAQTGGNLGAVRATFANETSTANFDSVKVGAHARFENAQFSGAVRFIAAQITGNLSAQWAAFTNATATADFDGLRVGGYARFGDAIFSGPVSFVAAQMGGNLECFGTKFRQDSEATNFNSMKVGGHAVFNDAIFSGPVSFVAAQITGSLEARRTTFTNAEAAADFDSMKVGGHARFDDAKFSGPVNFTTAQITGNLSAQWAAFTNATATADFSGMKAGVVSFAGSIARGPINMRDARFLDLVVVGPKENVEEKQHRYPLLDLSRTVITRELRIEDAELKKIIATSLQVSGPTSLTNLTVTEELNLEHSTFLNITLSNVSWPQGTKDSLLLAGMTYQHISAGDKPDSWRHLLALVKEAKYDASAYNTLEAFFRRQGYSNRADEVFLDHKRRVRGEFLGGIKWAWSAFLDYFVRYGRKPQLAFVWSLIVVILGCFVFRRQGMEPRNPGSKSSHYHSLWYSLDVFVPVIKLQAADDWVPKQDRRLARQYIYVHRLLGWILVPIGLAAVTGLIK